MYRKRVKRTSRVYISPSPVAVVSPVARIEPNTLQSNQMSDRTKDSEAKLSVNDKRFHLSLTQRKKKSSYFEDVVSACGFIIETGEGPNLLTQDQVTFTRDVKLKLKAQASHPRNVDDFIETFQTFCANNTCLKKALSATRTQEGCDVARGSEQESLVRLLLTVDCLQSKIIEFLFEKLTEFALTGDNDPDSAEDFPWVRLLLRQVRFLDHLVDPGTLHDLLFAVLEAAPVSVQIEVIFCLPDIIGDQQHEETAQKLSELLLQNLELSPAILDTLTNLTLDSFLRSTVTANVLKALQTVPVEFLPNVVKFLVTGTNTEDLSQVVTGLRTHLDFTPLAPCPSSGPVVDPSSSEVLTVANLRTAMVASRALAEAWLGAIKAVQSPSEHRPLDLIVLFVVHSAVPGAKKAVQSVFRSKARSGLFKEALLEKTFNSMLVVLKEYRSTVLEVASALLRSPEPAVVHHASCWYRLVLVHFPNHLGQAVVGQLLLHVGTGDVASARAALQLLAELAQHHLDRLAPHQLLLLNLLDKLADLGLPETERVMDVLCRLAYSSLLAHESAIHNDVHMLIRKQLASCNLLVKKKGVIGAVMAAKHIAAKEPEAEDSDQPPSGGDRMAQAVQLMELVTTSTQAYPEVTGLFFDKLSAVIVRVEDLDVNLTEWISNYVGTDFEENYICQKDQLQLQPHLSLQFELTDDCAEVEESDDVCITLGQLVERDSAQRRTPRAVLMNTSLRLVRCIKYLASDGDLHDLSALLVCGVVMPVHTAADFPALDPDEQHFILDCLFHCANWFRELLSAFAYQRDVELRKKVLLRLANLVLLQQTLGTCLPHAIDYAPPPCQFYASPRPPQPAKMKKPATRKKRKSKSKKGGKKKKSKDEPTCSGAGGTQQPEEDAEEEEEPDEEEQETTVAEPKGGAGMTTSLREYRGFLRELDVDVLILLQEKLVLEPEKDDPCLSPPLLQFLLEDFVDKLEHLLTPTVKRLSHLSTAAGGTPAGFANLELFEPINFSRNAIKMLRQLCVKLEMISEYCQKLLSENDGVTDAPGIFVDGSATIKLCYSYLMRVIADIFAWNGFHSSANTALLKDGLRVLAGRLDTAGSALGSVRELVRESARYLQGYTESTLHLPAAGSLVKLLEALARISDTDAALRKQIADTCHSFLSRRWFTLGGAPEHGAAYNQQVDNLLKTLAATVPAKLKATSEMAAWTYNELQQHVDSRDWSLDTFPTITKANFPLLHRSLCSTLLQGTSEALNSASDNDSKLDVWEESVATLRLLMLSTKLQSNRSNLVAFFRNSLKLLKLFLAQGLQAFGPLLRTRTADVTATLQSLQKSTRFLHTLCYHSKVTKDGTLTQQVPAMRQLLETLPISVRAMMTQLGCSDAFWLGVLRNRNLQGQEVLSQETTTEEAAQEEDLPPDDESSGDDLDGDAQAEQAGSDEDTAQSVSDIV